MVNEYLRKVLHVCVGLLILPMAIYLKTTYSVALIINILFVLLLFSLLADFLIADYGMRLPVYAQLQRTKERTGIHGSTFYVLSALLAFQFFTFEIALAAIATLSFGDAIAAIIGKRFGRPFYKKKSLAGSSAMFIVSCIACAVFLKQTPIIIGMAATGTLVEIFVDNIDDNLMIPLFAGTVGQLLLIYL